MIIIIIIECLKNAKQPNRKQNNFEFFSRHSEEKSLAKQMYGLHA